MMTNKFRIESTYIENGQELMSNRAYALGDYADMTWETQEEAEDIANLLRADVGDVVDASTKYCVVEVDDSKVIIGEWGFGSRSAGYIECLESERKAVQAAYDAIEDGDLSSDVLAGVIAAGGRYVEASNDA